MKRTTHFLPLAAFAGLALAAAPAHAALLAFDDFSSYTHGISIVGQTGSPTGFEAGAWEGNTNVGDTVTGGILNAQSNIAQRIRRSFGPAPLVATGSVYIRTNLALPTVGFVALELASVENLDASSVRLIGGGNLSLGTTTTGSGTGALLANDGLNHEWLIELNLDTKLGQVWIDENTAAFDPSSGGSGFTAPAAFQLNALNIAAFGGSSADISVDDIQIGQSWSDVGVNAIPEPSAVALLGLGGLALLRRRRK